jgi:hypothetical protein
MKKIRSFLFCSLSIITAAQAADISAPEQTLITYTKLMSLPAPTNLNLAQSGQNITGTANIGNKNCQLFMIPNTQTPTGWELRTIDCQ